MQQNLEALRRRLKGVSGMPQHRESLPQLRGGLFLTDGGLETTLIFRDGLDLPHFAAFHLLREPEGTAALRRYFTAYAQLAERVGSGLVLESATWRANADWASLLGYTSAALAEANTRAIDLLVEIRGQMAGHPAPIVISGCIGPRGDGYVIDQAMSVAQAEAYHAEQVETLARSQADIRSEAGEPTGVESDEVSTAVWGPRGTLLCDPRLILQALRIHRPPARTTSPMEGVSANPLRVQVVSFCKRRMADTRVDY